MRLPVLAIGGITPARVPDVVKAGASGIAAIGLFGRAEPRELVEVVGQVRQAFGATPKTKQRNRFGTPGRRLRCCREATLGHDAHDGTMFTMNAERVSFVFNRAMVFIVNHSRWRVQVLG